MSGSLIEKYILPGFKVDVRPIRRNRYADNGELNEKYYQSEVYDVLSADKIEIGMPMEKAKLILLPVGGEYDLYFYTLHGLYQCKAVVKDRYKRNNVYLLKMELTSNLRKEQRREYYRFSCALSMNSRLLEKEELQKVEEGKVEEGMIQAGRPLKRSVIVDISGGGLRFVSDFAYGKDEIIVCQYQLEEPEGTRVYEMVGKILHVKENENRPGVFEHRIQYLNIKEEAREEIIKYIFEKERKNLKNKMDE